MLRVVAAVAFILTISIDRSYGYSSSSSSSSSSNVDDESVEDTDKIVDELWYAFNEGRTRSADQLEESSSMSSSKEIKQSELLESLIPVIRTESSFDDDAPSTVLVYGSRTGLASMKILDAVPKSTVLSVEGREKYRESHLRRRQKEESKGKDLRSNLIAKDVTDDDDSFSDIIILEDMSNLVKGRLPHEFEEWIASLFQKARAIVILDSIPKTRYFKYWSGTMNLVLSALSVSDVSADVRDVEYKKRSSSSWGYDSEEKYRAIVVIREDVPKRSNGGYYSDTSYYDPDTATKIHVGKSSTDMMIRPNTKGVRRCSNEPSGEDSSGDRFHVVVTRDFVSVTRTDMRGSGWGQDLTLLCKTTGSFHQDDWNEPHNDVSRDIFTSWYFSISKLRSHGLISEDRSRVFMFLLRSMPSMPFLRDKTLEVVSSTSKEEENSWDNNEYSSSFTKQVKIQDVDLYYGAGVFRFAVQKESYDGTASVSLVGTEVHENVPRRENEKRRIDNNDVEYESGSIKKKEDKDDDESKNLLLLLLLLLSTWTILSNHHRHRRKRKNPCLEQNDFM